jgi:putative PIN family toxin of toxin-antitoxin system
MKLRLVVDTNLWISYLIGVNSQQMDLLFGHPEVTLLVSATLLTELESVALRPKFKKYFDVDDLYRILNLITQICEVVDVTSSISACRDEKDNFLLELSVDGGADHLITGDNDLLEMKRFESTVISTLSEFLQRIG